MKVAALLAAAAALLFFDLGGVAGLHRDEGAFGLFAEQILAGARPLHGFFNYYTAPIHSYIIAATFRVFGESVFTLRLSGVLLNLLAALAFWRVVRRIAPEAALAALALLVTSPVFVAFARMAGENYALNPLLFFGGIWAYQNAESAFRDKIARLWLAGAGLCFALGCWNHIVFAATLAAIVLVYLVATLSQIRIVARTRLPWILAGALIPALVLAALVSLRGGLEPALTRLVHELFARSPGGKYNYHPLAPWNALLNFLATLDGHAIFIRMTGRMLFDLGWLPLVTLVTLGALFTRRGPSEARLTLALASIALVMAAAATWLMTPSYLVGARIWLLPAWLLPLLIAVSLLALRPSWRQPVLLALVALNLANLSLNYFYSFKSTGGHATLVDEGGRIDNSYDFIDLHPLVDALLHKTTGTVYLNNVGTWALAFLLPPEARSRIEVLISREVLSGQRSLPPGTLVINFRSSDGPWPEEIPAILPNVPARLRKDLSSENFAFYELER